MNVRELLAKIGFEVHEEPLEKLEHTLDGIKERLELFAGAEIAHKLYEVAEHFAEWGEELNTTALNLGLNVEELQEFGAAAKSAGVSQEAMTQGLSVLSRKLYEVRNGSKEAGDAFYKVGISAEQIAGFRNAKDALLAVSDKLAGMTDPIERVAVAQELLGRGGQRMVAFLSKGSHAINEETEAVRKLGLTLSGGQVHALVEVGEAFTKLHMIMHAIGATIAATIGPAFTFLIDKVVALYAANRDLISANIHNWLMNVAYGMGFTVGLVIGLTKQVIRLAKALGIDKDILKYVAMIGGAAGALTTLGVAFSVVSGIFSAAAPFLSFMLILGGIIAAVHDLWAVFNESPTWTGSVIDWVKNLEPVKAFFKDIQDEAGNVDFDKLGDKLATKFEAVLEQLKKKMADLFSGENMDKAGDLLDKFVTSDGATRLVDALAKALDAALIVSGFAFTLGFTIAGAIATGLESLFKEKFPVAGQLLFGEGTKLKDTGVVQPDTDENGNTSILSRISAAVLGGGVGGGESLGSIAFDAFKDAAQRIAGGGAAASGGDSTTHVTVHVPPGVTDPKAVGEHVGKAVSDHDAERRRQIKRDLTPQVTN